MYSDDELIPISALSQFVFCPRRCALIHLEQVWVDNQFTAEGELLHEHVHELSVSGPAGVRRVTAMPVRSLTYGLIGQCDLVEFVPTDGSERPYPVEFKRGTPRRGDCDLVQLCAQAMCLEEMLGHAVPSGAVYYAKLRRRKAITFSPALRDYTRRLISEVRQLFLLGHTPPASLQSKCSACSLIDFCTPQHQPSARAHRLLRELFEDLDQ
ncbi:MAG: CRISPR-associated protein Cas4 [Halothiobacillaceae bacterium]